MVDLTFSGWRNKLHSFVSAYAVAQAAWHRDSNPGSHYMNTGPLMPLSNFGVVGEVTSDGSPTPTQVIRMIRDTAFKCTSIRRVLVGRTQSGSAYGNRVIGQDIKIAALDANYQQSFVAAIPHTAAQYGIETGKDLLESGMDQYLDFIQMHLDDLIYHSTVINLQTCHDNCHNNCHGSRSRR